MGTSASPQWAILAYLNYNDLTLHQLAEIGASSEIQLLIQANHENTAERRIFYAPSEPQPEPMTIPFTDTSAPIMLTDFIAWALENTTAPRLALICRAGKISGFDSLSETPSLPTCEVEQLQQVLFQGLKDTAHQQLDALFLLSPASQFIEIADQLSDVAQFLIGAQTDPPSPEKIGAVIAQWQRAAAKKPLSPRSLAALAIDTAPALSAINLSQLNDVTRAFDALTMALLQSLGDDIIWATMWHAEREKIFPALPAAAKHHQTNLDLVEWLKFVHTRLSAAARTAIPRWYLKKLKKTDGALRAELRRIGRNTTDPISLEIALTENLHTLPEWLANDFHIIQSQRRRATNLAEMAARILSLLRDTNDIVLTPAAETPFRHGISIYLPRNIDRLTESSYLSLDFCRHTRWTSLLGAINLIAKHPRALWRLSSSLLTTANSAVREDLLRRLIGPESVMVGFREQFQALATPAKLTLTLEPQNATLAADPIHTTNIYRLRLESPETGATVLEQHSRVNPQTIDTALEGLEDLLTRGWVNAHRMDYLESLGRTLGEDIIQNLAENLQDEYRQMAWLGSGVPHLQLQLPRQLMRYPWELLHDGEGLLLERYALGRQVFADAAITKPKPLRPSGGIRVLIIGDPLLDADFLAESAENGQRWQQLPDAAEEAQHVATVFSQLGQIFGSAINFQTQRDTYIRRSLTCLQFREILRRGEYDIIHFAGHAMFDANNPEQSAWLLSDGPLWAQEIRNTLARAKRSPWLVYANACEAAMESGAPGSGYQGDVFGLATAFIQQGVAAYIAPLWRINDSLAAQMAIDFYHALLLNSASLGEALRFARLEAKRQATGIEKNSSLGVPLPATIGLGWAGMVLYGDPTARPLDSLWTPHHLPSESHPKAMPRRSTVPRRPQLKRPQYILQSPTDETLALVTGPGMTPIPTDRIRGAHTLGEGELLLELVELNGIRCWQTRNPDTGEAVPLAGSIVPQLQKSDAIRQTLGLERGFAGYARTIGRWVFRRDDDSLIFQLGEQYDRSIVPKEKLWQVNPDTTLRDAGSAPWWWVDGNTQSQTDRVLLILHGTFSSAYWPTSALGAEFMQWATQYYRGVIAYDHWTVSRSPLDNAKALWDLLDERLRTGSGRIDILAHSRGGLVARSLVELMGYADAIRHVIFAATPNSGSNWVSPQNWGNAADHLINMLHLDNFGFYGRLSSFLARLLINQSGLERLTATIESHLPGIQAQNPQAVAPDDFLGKLQRGDGPPDSVTYAAVAANYEPPGAQLTLGSVVKKATALLSDTVTDNFLASYNDLVVDTPRVWAVDPEPGMDSSEAMPWLPGENLMVYNPGQQMKLPTGAMSLNVAGVHHSNILYFPQTRNFIRNRLSR